VRAARWRIRDAKTIADEIRNKISMELAFRDRRKTGADPPVARRANAATSRTRKEIRAANKRCFFKERPCSRSFASDARRPRSAGNETVSIDAAGAIWFILALFSLRLNRARAAHGRRG